MKRTIVLKTFYGKVFQNNKIFSIDNGHNIFFRFDEALQRDEIKIITVDTLRMDDYPDKYVYCDTPYPWEYKLWFDLVQHKEKNILFCFDSPIITPFSHMKSLHLFFSKIYTWDDSLIDEKRYFKMHFPQLSTNIRTTPKPFHEKKFLVLINAKKSSPLVFKLIAKYKTDLYKERLNVIHFFEKHQSNLFSFYGRGWNSENKTYQTYKGEIPTDKKIETLSNFKFCICFENSIAPGFITEKIFDCFKARCIPIYWGAPNITKYINKDCFIDFRDFMDYEKLLHYLEDMSEKTYNKYLESIEAFLHDSKTREDWFEGGFRNVFLQSIA